MSADPHHAKEALLTFARTHDAQREARRKPVRNMAIAAGVAVVASRLLLGGARRAAGRGGGGKLMGLLFVARLAIKYGPALVEGIRRAKQAYDAAPRRATPPVRVRARLVEPDRLPHYTTAD